MHTVALAVEKDNKLPTITILIRKKYYVLTALIKVSGGGLSIKSKAKRLSIPRDLSINTTLHIFVRRISGVVLGSNSC